METNYELANNTLFLKGAITVNTAGNLLGMIKNMFVGQAEFNKIDCSQVVQADSAVISLLLSCLREAKKNNREINIVGMNDKLSELAMLYEVQEVFHH